MEEICSNCNKKLRTGSKFCAFCGTPVKIKERRCNKCNELLEDEEIFCPMCGEKYTEVSNITPAPSFTTQKERIWTTGTLVDSFDAETLSFLSGTGEDVKKAVEALKEKVKGVKKWSDGIFLYNKDEEVAFIRRDNSPFIEAYSYKNIQAPFRKYTVSNEVDLVWEKSSYA